VTYRIGLAGCGWIAPYQLDGWKLVPGVEVVAVCDRDLSRARALAEQSGIQWSGQDAVHMMEDCSLDIIDIATTPESHKDIALAALERGLHVVCQKPLSTGIRDAEEMIEYACGRGLVLYVNEMLRFCPWFRKIRELLYSGAIGRPVFARLFSRVAGFVEVGPERVMSFGFREYFKAQPRAIVLEETIHYLDVLRYLFGEPGSIYAVTENVSPALRGEDLATAVLKFPGLTAVIEDSWSAHGPARSGAEIEGREGAALLTHAKVLEYYSGRSGRLEKTWDFSQQPWPQQRPLVFAALFADFLNLVASGGDGVAQARDNLRTLRLTLAAYESAASGAEIGL
jgi:predicted dehydrogenase